MPKGKILMGKTPVPGKPGRGGGRKLPMPVKPAPKGGKNPKLPYRYEPGKGPKLPKPGKPVKPTPKGGGIRDLLYKAKPGEMKKRPATQVSSKDVNNQKMSKYDQMIAKGQISVMRRPKLNNEKARKDNSPIKDTIQSMFKGTGRKRDNSAVTYSTRVKPKGPQSMMAAPYRIKKAMVKTGRGR